MASYTEIQKILSRGVPGADALRDEVEIACAVAAQLIISGNDGAAPFDQNIGKHEQRVLWAIQFLNNPKPVAYQMFIIVVVANESVPQTNILEAIDAAIQTNVNESIDALAANL